MQINFLFPFLRRMLILSRDIKIYYKLERKNVSSAFLLNF